MTSPATSFEKPIRHTYLVADLKCYMCGSVCGTIESAQADSSGAVPGRAVTLRQPGQNTAVEVLDWTHLRCERCGGPLFLDDTDVVTRRVDAYNWLDERPRRGRPPKRLLEQRRRERELLDLGADPQAA